MERTPDFLTLSGPDHNLMLVSGLWQMFRSNVGVDYDVGGGVRAHRCLLDVFLSTDRIKVGSVKRLLAAGSLESMMEFLYTGRVTVRRDQLDSLHEAAKETGFRLLLDAVAAATTIRGDRTGSPKSSSVRPTAITSDPVEEADDVVPKEIPRPSYVCLREMLSAGPSLGNEVSRSCAVADNHTDHGSPLTGLGSPVFENVADDEVPLDIQIKEEPADTSDDEETPPPHVIVEGEPAVTTDDEETMHPDLHVQDEPAEMSDDDGTMPLDVRIKEEPAEPSDTQQPGSVVRVNATPKKPPRYRNRPRNITRCTVCNKTFDGYAQLENHQRLHTGEKPFECETCGKRFRTNANRILHVRTHTGYKPYQCHVCNKSFAQRSSFTTHSRTHTGEKRFACFCGKSFTRATSLRAHANSSHDGDVKMHREPTTGHTITVPACRP